MKAHKGLFYSSLITGITLLAFYLVCIILNWDNISNILSPTIAALCSAVFVIAYNNSENKKTTAKTLIAFALVCFTWFIGDVFWAISLTMGEDPTKNIVANFFYFFSNIFIAGGLALFLFYHLKKLKSLQLLVDAIGVSVISVFSIWITYFKKSNLWLNSLLQDGVFSLVSIILDFMIMIGIIVILYSFRKIKAPKFAKFFILGTFIYAFNDALYYYINANGLYVPNSISDVIFILAIFICTIGALIKMFFEPDTIIKSPEYTGIGKRWIVLFVYPIATIFFQGFIFWDILFFVSLIVAYKALSMQVELVRKNKELYLKEVELNNVLEKRIEEQYAELKFFANNDTITKLNNRRYFVDSLEKTINSLSIGDVLAVFMIDVDRFKTINDSHGHDVGDKVLIEISNRIFELVKDKAVISRLGGDEFALFFKGTYSPKELEMFAQEIIKNCSQPIVVDKNILYVTISLGIAIYNSESDDRIKLMQNADIAMYRAKSQGYNKYVFYDPFFKENIDKKNVIEGMLRKANIEKEFELFYQPQFCLVDNKLIGVEALIRWKSVEHGYIIPNEFISIAEEIDYITKIGKWVMYEAVRQIIKWNIAYSLDLKMGINISPKQLYEDDFIDTLNAIMKNEHCSSTWLDAEITENIMIEENNRINLIFDSFKKLGVSVSLDDFGSGYSSWGYLNKYPFNRIKIDKTLIDQLNREDTNGAQVVKAIISMANAMDKKTIAEGVETKEQMEILKELGCDQAQGFLLGIPVSVEEFEKTFIKKTLTNIHN